MAICSNCDKKDICAIPAYGVYAAECSLRDSEATKGLVFSQDGYASLRGVLDSALAQASGGKGAERHANGLPFEDQPIMQITRLLGEHPVAALAYQVIKKTVEAGKLYKLKGPEAAMQEMHGAINYAAAVVLRLQELSKEQKQ